MEREQIIREDFAVVRKGWDPDGVRAHLRSVAESMPAGGVPAAEASLGDVAAGRIRTVLEAAEHAASEIQTSAQSDADGRLSAAVAEAEQILAGARAESEQIVSRARVDADAHVGEAQRAVEGLIGQAEQIRAQVASLGERLAAAAPKAEVPGPVIVPEPSPPMIPEPTPDPVPEPTPDPMPDPTPVPEPTPDPTPEPPVPEPAPTLAGTTTEDLIAQLRSASPAAPAANGSISVAAVSGSDLGATRLVAMNMALDGASREQISAQLSAEFGDVPDIDGLLDEILARAER